MILLPLAERYPAMLRSLFLGIPLIVCSLRLRIRVPVECYAYAPPVCRPRLPSAQRATSIDVFRDDLAPRLSLASLFDLGPRRRRCVHAAQVRASLLCCGCCSSVVSAPD